MTASFLLPLCAHAVNVDWDGNGDANASGTWETDANWTGDGKPTASDNARLLDVTSGTREVTISDGSPQTINKLTITQTTVGAVNVLNLDDDLTISGNTTPFAITASAGQGSIVTNIAAGKTLLATWTGGVQNITNFGGTLNLNAGSIFRLEGDSFINTPKFDGPINVSGAGAELVFKAGSYGTVNVTFNGAIVLSGVGTTFNTRALTSADAVTGIGGSNSFNGNDGSGNAINLGVGTQFSISADGSNSFTKAVVLAGTDGVNSGAIFNLGVGVGTGARTQTFQDNLTLGAGSLLNILQSGNGPAVVLEATTTMASGSTLVIGANERAGGFSLTNNGILTMDDSAVKLDNAHTSASGTNNSSTGRNFKNTGTWTMQNASTVAFISSTGKNTSGFGIGSNNENSGTLNVESGSQLGFLNLFNTGTLNLGSSTANVSDATVNLGSPDDTFGDVTLTNGLTAPLPTSSDAAGTIHVLGNAYLGRIAGSGKTTLNNGSATSTGSLIEVGDTTTPTTFTVSNNSQETTNFAGNTITLNPNGALVLQYKDAQGTNLFTNAGILNSDNGDLIFDNAGSGFNNPGNNNIGRRFANSGTMTLENNSNLDFISSTGKAVSGFGIGQNNENTGTINLKSGSTLAFDGLFSTGVLNLGSSTAGVSDATVYLGSPSNTFQFISLNNGQTAPTPTSVDGAGTINILGDTWLGRTTDANGTVTLNNGTATSVGSAIMIGDGTVPVTFTVSNQNVAINNFAGNTIDLKANATLLLRSTAIYSTTGNVALINDGTFTHAGTVLMQGTFNGTRNLTTSSTGTYRISGSSAVIESLEAAAGTQTTNVASVGFSVAGLLTGATSYDKLTYTNSTNNPGKDTLELTMSGGEITPGNGTNGSGVSSIGTLEFVNTNITLSGATKLSFDIGGLGNDDAPLDVEFNPVLTFDYILTNSTFSIGSDAVLDIRMANNGFVTPSEQSYLLVDSTNGGPSSFTGTFSTLLFEGVAVTDQYTVAYTSSGLLVTLAAGLGNSAPIPEPSSVVMLAGLGVIAFAGLRRRQRV